MNKIITIKCGDWKKSKTVLLCMLLLGATIFIYGCSKPRTKDVSWCDPNQELSSYWAEFNLPKVDGAVFCREYKNPRTNRPAVQFIHYRNDEQHFRDFYELYEKEFKRNNWLIEKINPGQGILIISLYKSRERFLATFRDCSVPSDVRLCSSIQITADDTDVPHVR